MKAYVLHSVNDLRYEDVKKPELREGWALIRVKVSGICSADIPRILLVAHIISQQFQDMNFLGLWNLFVLKKIKGI